MAARHIAALRALPFPAHAHLVGILLLWRGLVLHGAGTPPHFRSCLVKFHYKKSRWKKEIRPKCEFCDVNVQVLQFIRPDGRRGLVQPTHLKRYMQSHSPESKILVRPAAAHEPRLHQLYFTRAVSPQG